jgi:hypothetical protein
VRAADRRLNRRTEHHHLDRVRIDVLNAVRFDLRHQRALVVEVEHPIAGRGRIMASTCEATRKPKVRTP